MIFSPKNSLLTINLDLLAIPFHQLISFFLVGVFVPFASGELWQRIYAIKDQKNLKKSLVISSVLYLSIGVILLFIGLTIKSSMTNLDPDTALVVGLNNLLPVSLGSLATIIFFSAIMSSLDTYLFTSSTSLVQDILGKNNIGKKYNTIQMIRVALFILIVIAILLSLLTQNVVTTSLSTVALIVSLGFIIFLSWIFPKINRYSLSFAATFSIVGTIEFLSLKLVSLYITIHILFLTLLGVIVGWLFNLFFVQRILDKEKPIVWKHDKWKKSATTRMD